MSLKISPFMSTKRELLPFLSSLLCAISAVFSGIALWILLTSPVSAGQDNKLDNIRIVIDTKTSLLQVLQDDREVLVFSDIAIGRYGTSLDRRRGDNTTPLGHFKIAWITDNTSFHRFFGFNFPTKEYADRAFRSGRLDQKTRNKIHKALAAGRLPPQNTILGGSLGIHGIGKGDINVHKQYNWTNGCVALTNDQIDQLTVWVRIGTPVEIR
ncbi:MAG: L,D-transpeptidase [Desulforhopalus sp.]